MANQRDEEVRDGEVREDETVDERTEDERAEDAPLGEPPVYDPIRDIRSTWQTGTVYTDEHGPSNVADVTPALQEMLDTQRGLVDQDGNAMVSENDREVAEEDGAGDETVSDPTDPRNDAPTNLKDKDPNAVVPGQKEDRDKSFGDAADANKDGVVSPEEAKAAADKNRASKSQANKDQANKS